MIHITTLHCFHLAKLIRGYQEVLDLVKLKLDVGNFANKGLDCHISIGIDIIKRTNSNSSTTKNPAIEDTAAGTK